MVYYENGRCSACDGTLWLVRYQRLKLLTPPIDIFTMDADMTLNTPVSYERIEQFTYHAYPGGPELPVCPRCEVSLANRYM